MNKIQKRQNKSSQKKKATESALKSKDGAKDFELKYKTELCKNFLNGTCEFGIACVFAHGADELRAKECFQFAQTGHCSYGNRCQFAHKKEPQTSASSSVHSGSSSRKSSIDDSRPTIPLFIDLERRNFF